MFRVELEPAKLLRGSPEIWLRMQAARDLWEIGADQERLAAVKPLDRRLLAER